MEKAQIPSDSKIPSLDDAFTRVLRIESSPTGVIFLNPIVLSLARIIASTCDIPETLVTISADEYAKFQNYQDSLQTSSSTHVASTVAPACFLINRMPSSILNGKIPYRVLFPTKSLFPIAPEIFGCVYFVRNVRPHHTKLDTKSLKCIFLGYSLVQKGYRCYCPTLKRYLVPPGVAFS
ncbi:putative Polyprotein [Cucumis melo var. makuwa]|uniref:Polyprotein n=1 Tax=Cucumis melo var. makuwa TaxID=1194695 RepID=A0A5A7VDQ4_CUCMM|nr:putative Polyprotein [Cucumis melo var. makuwa]